MPLRTAKTAEAHFEATKNTPMEYPRWINRKVGPPVQVINEEHERQIMAADSVRQDRHLDVQEKELQAERVKNEAVRGDPVPTLANNVSNAEPMPFVKDEQERQATAKDEAIQDVKDKAAPEPEPEPEPEPKPRGKKEK